jgi:predicted RNase H-like nuclease
VRFVGIDLAWSTKNRTGLAVVDVDGRLLDSATVRTDEEIERWVRGQGEVLVAAVDAPLIVPNETGQRVGENEVQRAFGAYGAGPYPANRSRPWFRPPRGETLARTMSWSMDPSRHGTPGEPVCIEVYPHPAMVALFELPTVLPYKSGRGRTPEARRDTFTTLAEHMESIEPLRLAENERWQHLRAAVEGASRHMHLEAVEDEIDAVLCAHLA